MRRIWIEPADGKFAVMAELETGKTQCLGRYAKEPQAQARLVQLARTAPGLVAGGGEAADGYKHLPATPRA